MITELCAKHQEYRLVKGILSFRVYNLVRAKVPVNNCVIFLIHAGIEVSDQTSGGSKKEIMNSCRI